MKTYTITHNKVTYTAKLIVGGTVEWSNGITTVTDFWDEDYPRQVFNEIVAMARKDGYNLGMVVWSLSSQQ